MRIDLTNLDSTHIMAVALVAMAIFIPFGIALDKPTKEESYNQALRNCANLQSLDERNTCRVQVTKYYKDIEEKQ